MVTLHLHVGIHKTASTYIQHRLKNNQKFLRRRRIFYPHSRSDHLSLLKAFRCQEANLWDDLLRQASREGCHDVLVSAESFSLALSARARGNSLDSACGPSNVDWLAQLAADRGCALKIYAFVRDQGDYLLSRYTQLIKRFYFALDFPGYVDRVMEGGSESECDYQVLFGDVLNRPDITSVFLPFIKGVVDPCERLLQCMAIEKLDDLQPLREAYANVQPGWRAVWIAQRVARRLRRSDPDRWKSAAVKAALRSELEAAALKNNWMSEPFSALTADLRVRIDSHYRQSNNIFAQQVWGRKWFDVVPKRTDSISSVVPIQTLERAEKQRLKQEVEHLLACALNLSL